MVALVTCKTEEDPIKNEGARVATNLYVDFQTFKARRIQWCYLTEIVACKNDHKISPIIRLRGFFQTLKGS